MEVRDRSRRRRRSADVCCASLLLPVHRKSESRDRSTSSPSFHHFSHASLRQQQQPPPPPVFLSLPTLSPAIYVLLVSPCDVRPVADNGHAVIGRQCQEQQRERGEGREGEKKILKCRPPSTSPPAVLQSITHNSFIHTHVQANSATTNQSAGCHLLQHPMIRFEPLVQTKERKGIW